jgi:hypothetical protein
MSIIKLEIDRYIDKDNNIDIQGMEIYFDDEKTYIMTNTRMITNIKKIFVGIIECMIYGHININESHKPVIKIYLRLPQLVLKINENETIDSDNLLLCIYFSASTKHTYSLVKYTKKMYESRINFTAQSHTKPLNLHHIYYVQQYLSKITNNFTCTHEPTDPHKIVNINVRAFNPDMPVQQALYIISDLDALEKNYSIEGLVNLLYENNKNMMNQMICKSWYDLLFTYSNNKYLFYEGQSEKIYFKELMNTSKYINMNNHHPCISYSADISRKAGCSHYMKLLYLCEKFGKTNFKIIYDYDRQEKFDLLIKQFCTNKLHIRYKNNIFMWYNISGLESLYKLKTIIDHNNANKNENQYDFEWIFDNDDDTKNFIKEYKQMGAKYKKQIINCINRRMPQKFFAPMFEWFGIG